MYANSFAVVTPGYMKALRYGIILNECGFICPGISMVNRTACLIEGYT